MTKSVKKLMMFGAVTLLLVGCNGEDVHQKPFDELEPLVQSKAKGHNRNTHTINQAINDAKFVKKVHDRFNGGDGEGSAVGKWVGNKAKEYARNNPDKVIRTTKKAVEYRMRQARQKDARLNRLLEEEDKILDRAYFKALRIGKNTTWKNPKLGSYGTIYLSAPYKNKHGSLCYNVTSRATRAGEREVRKAVACYERGRWVTYS